MSDTASATLLDETGQPIGRPPPAPGLVDAAGSAIRSRPRPPGAFSELESTLRAYPWAALAIGVVLGFALGQVRR